MAFELIDLPYDDTALEPAVSAKTLSFHHGKHHKSYLDKTTKAIEGTDLELDLTILQIRANKGKIRDESRGAPPPKEGEEDTAHIFGEEPRWPDEL